MMKKLMMMVVNEVKQFLSVMKPTYSGVISYSDLKKMLKEYGVNEQKIVIGDNIYFTSSVEIMQKFTKYNLSRIRHYTINKYDCENFSNVLLGQASLMLPGCAFGVVHVERPQGLHALNFFIGKDKTFWYLEPQNNSIFNYGVGKQKGYKIVFVYI